MERSFGVISEGKGNLCVWHCNLRGVCQ